MNSLYDWSRKPAPSSQPIKFSQSQPISANLSQSQPIAANLSKSPLQKICLFILGVLAAFFRYFHFSDWPLWYLLFWFYETQWKCTLIRCTSSLMRRMSTFFPRLLSMFDFKDFISCSTLWSPSLLEATGRIGIKKRKTSNESNAWLNNPKYQQRRYFPGGREGRKGQDKKERGGRGVGHGRVGLGREWGN